MEQVRMVRCGLCNTKADIREMKYHKSGDYLLCKACHEKQNPGQKVVVEKPASLREVSEMPRQESKVSYRCKNCGYSFARARDHHFDVCPYCGKNSVSMVNRGGAQSFLDESPY